jgi:hypothetical protein
MVVGVHSMSLDANGRVENVHENSYDSFIMIAELLRNVCVNLGIDPQQEGGIIANVKFHMSNQEDFQKYRKSMDCPVASLLNWNHEPHLSTTEISDIVNGSDLYLIVVEVY